MNPPTRSFWQTPRQRLDVLSRVASEAGFDFQRNDDEATAQEFAHDGLDLHHYQQEFLVDGMVRVSFFAPDEALRRILSGRSESKVRVAGLTRLCSGVPQRDDEGFAHLLPNAPALDEMNAFFIEQRNKLEIENAAEAARRQPNKNQPEPT